MQYCLCAGADHRLSKLLRGTLKKLGKQKVGVEVLLNGKGWMV